MFTGLVEAKGEVIRIERGPNGNMRLTLASPEIFNDVSVGDSVAVDGVCLTAVSVHVPNADFDVVRETVERSTLGRLNVGDFVNLERALRLGERLGGHLVLGHVDGVGIIRDVRRITGSTLFRIDAPLEVMRYVVKKGSIAVDGISLTVADLGPTWFSVAVIPHTLEQTTLGAKSVGDTVNLETDIIGKYVEKFVAVDKASDDRILELLSEGGFLE